MSTAAARTLPRWNCCARRAKPVTQTPFGHTRGRILSIRMRPLVVGAQCRRPDLLMPRRYPGNQPLPPPGFLPEPSPGTAAGAAAGLESMAAEPSDRRQSGIRTGLRLSVTGPAVLTRFDVNLVPTRCHAGVSAGCGAETRSRRNTLPEAEINSETFYDTFDSLARFVQRA